MLPNIPCVSRRNSLNLTPFNDEPKSSFEPTDALAKETINTANNLADKPLTQRNVLSITELNTSLKNAINEGNYELFANLVSQSNFDTRKLASLLLQAAKLRLDWFNKPEMRDNLSESDLAYLQLCYEFVENSLTTSDSSTSKALEKTTAWIQSLGKICSGFLSRILLSTDADIRPYKVIADND